MLERSIHSSDQSPQRLGKNFENYIALIYEGLGFRVITNASLSGQQIDILAEKAVSGVGVVRLIVECKHRSSGTVSNQEIYDFIKMIDAIKDKNQITKAIMVTDGDFSKDAFAAAQSSRMVELVRATTLEHNLFDLYDAYRDTIKEYEATEIFLTYVPLHADIGHFEPAGPKKVERKRRVTDVELELINYIDSTDIGFISILADYGSGKTTLLQRLKYYYAKEYISGRSTIKPLFIPLKNYHKMHTLDELIQDCIRREFRREMPLKLFWQAAAEGKLLLLLDGFDELAPQVDIQRRRENFIALSPLFTLKSKAILTCRPSYFVTEQEYEDAIRLVNEISSPGHGPFKSSERRSFRAKKAQYDVLLKRLFSKFVDYEPLRSINKSHTAIVELQSFDENQIDSFLKKFDAMFIETCKRDWRSVKEFLMKIYDLSDLMRRPILLNMINVTILESGKDIFSHAHALGPSSLYDLYTKTQLSMDWHKGESRQLLTKEQRRAFAESIALGMFEAKKLEVSYEEILYVVSKHESILDKLRSKLETISPEEVATDIQICAFLSRDQNGLFRFSHKSFMEYFVAVYLKRALQSNRVDKRFEEFLPKEILYFIGGFAYVEPGLRQLLIDWFKNKKPVSGIDDFRRNIAGALFYSGPEHKNLRLENATIFDVEIAKLRMFKAKFKNINFSRVNQEKITSTNSIYQNIEYSQSHINGWELRNCDLSSNIVDTTVEDLNAHASRLMLTGRRASIQKSHFEQCDLYAMGNINFERTSFSNGNLQVPYVEGGCSLNFDSCQFTEVKMTSADFDRNSIKVSGCRFQNSSLLGLRLSGDEFLKSSFYECKGVLIIGEPLSDLRNKFVEKRKNMMVQGGVLLVQARAWVKEGEREELFTEMAKVIGNEFVDELWQLSSPVN